MGITATGRRRIRYLIPDEASREHFFNWLAWLLQHPDKKLMHSALLLGNKRTGKSWFTISRADSLTMLRVWGQND